MAWPAASAEAASCGMADISSCGEGEKACVTWLLVVAAAGEAEKAQSGGVTLPCWRGMPSHDLRRDDMKSMT